MSLLGNILWFVLGGFIGVIAWLVIGVLWCLTIIGIPIGLQCFKMARLYVSPFGKQVTLSGETMPIIVNIIWLILGGIELAIASALTGLVLCATIVGIPFGLQHFKMAKLALMPVGAKVE